MIKFYIYLFIIIFNPSLSVAAGCWLQDDNKKDTMYLYQNCTVFNGNYTTNSKERIMTREEILSEIRKLDEQVMYLYIEITKALK